MICLRLQIISFFSLAIPPRIFTCVQQLLFFLQSNSQLTLLNCAAAAAAAASKSFGPAGVCCWPCGRRCRWSHRMSNEKIKKKKVINDEFIRIDGMSIRQLSQCQKPCINDHLAWCISVYRCGWVAGRSQKISFGGHERNLRKRN